jgi:Asp-tRNA(Asn)/Glu-tRNA(Gln) amidotransferase A subunit family amidase
LLKEEHLPVGVQLMGFDWRDADLFAVAGAVETMLET